MRKHVIFTRENNMFSSHVKRSPLLWLHNKSCLSQQKAINPLSPNIHILILRTDNRSKHFLFSDHFINSHKTISLGNIWILLGENWCWSPLGLKGLTWNGLVFHWCLYNKQNITWSLGDTKFLFLLWNIIHHSKRNIISYLCKAM